MNIKDVKFYLKSPSSKTPTSIYSKFTFNHERIKIYIRKKIHPQLWDKNNQAPTNDKKIINTWKKKVNSINIELDNITSRIRKSQNVITSFINMNEQAGKPISSNSIKNHYNRTFGFDQKEKQTKNYVVEYVQKLINGMANGTVLKNNKQRYAYSTIKNYMNFQSMLKEFEQTKNKKFRFDDIDMKFYNEYVTFFHDKDYSPNTVGRQIKHLKVVMRSAHEEGLHNNEIYKRKKFRTIDSPVDTIYLTESDLDKINALDLSSKPLYENVRDIFLLGCYTALRYSDLSRIKSHHIIGEKKDEKSISIKMKKVEGKVVVPLSPKAYNILKKHNFNIPQTTAQSVNKMMKIIGKLAQIDELIEHTEYKGSRKNVSIKPKYELISTHTARRTAVTNMFKSKIPLHLIMKITGHSSEKNVLKYIRIDKNEAAEILRETDFFK